MVDVHVYWLTIVAGNTELLIEGDAQVSSTKLSSSCLFGKRQSLKPPKLLFLAAVSAPAQVV